MGHACPPGCPLHQLLLLLLPPLLQPPNAYNLAVAFPTPREKGTPKKARRRKTRARYCTNYFRVPKRSRGLQPPRCFPIRRLPNKFTRFRDTKALPSRSRNTSRLRLQEGRPMTTKQWNKLVATSLTRLSLPEERNQKKTNGHGWQVSSSVLQQLVRTSFSAVGRSSTRATC